VLDGDKRKNRTPIEQKGKQPKVAQESGRSSNQKARNNLEAMDSYRDSRSQDRGQPKKKKQKQESADDDEHRERTRTT
jgi:hypothetical protein